MRMDDLERRIKTLEDIEEIKRLKARYCAYCDENYDAEGIAGLFTEDAVWDGGIRGRADGQQEIRDFFTQAAQRLPFAIHMVMNPIIQVDGDHATGMWYLFQACTYAEDNRAVWGSGRYDEKYVRVDGDWKFRHLTRTSHFWPPFDEGWAKTRFS